MQHIMLLKQDVNRNHESRKIIEKVVTIIESEYMKDINLTYLSEQVYLTPSYLSFLFKKEFNIGIVKFITDCRLARAKGLLISTTMKIIDVGQHVGYHKPLTFA